jgi:CBS domain-containing protein
MIARELMDTEAPTLSPEDTIQLAAELLTDYRHSDLAVLDAEGRIIGAVFEEDLLALALPAGGAADVRALRYLPRCYGLRDLSDDKLRGLRVADIMRKDEYLSIEEEELAAQAALLMMRGHQPQLFVTRDGRYVGRLGRKMIISQLINPTLGVACHP